MVLVNIHRARSLPSLFKTNLFCYSHDTVISRWKKEFIERSPRLFEQGSITDERDQRIAELERMIGRLAVELEMAKKVSRFLS